MNSSEIKLVLERALARLKAGEAWTQHAFARDDAGVEVDPSDPRAASWCALGAVYAELKAPFAEFRAVTSPLRIRRVPTALNDNARSFDEVRRLYEDAFAWLDA